MDAAWPTLSVVVMAAAHSDILFFICRFSSRPTRYLPVDQDCHECAHEQPLENLSELLHRVCGCRLWLSLGRLLKSVSMREGGACLGPGLRKGAQEAQHTAENVLADDVLLHIR